MYKIYQVEFGDTIDSIASKVGTTVEDLIKINGMNGNSLMAGDLIIVPSPNSDSNNEMFIKYNVQNGDTLYMIARNYNIDLDTLTSLNGLNKEDYIYPNQEIIIPKENILMYVTKDGDTIQTILDNFNITLDKFMMDNNNIYLKEDQLIINKRDNY